MDQATTFKPTAKTSVGGSTAAGTNSRAFCDLKHPLDGSKDLLVASANDETDVSGTRLRDELREAAGSVSPDPRLKIPIASLEVSNRCYRSSRTMTRITYIFWNDTKPAWLRNARPLAHRSGVPTMGRIRPSWTRARAHLPFSPVTFGWVTTREPLVCLLGKWKFEAGRAWEISWVVLTSVRVTFPDGVYPVQFIVVISCRNR
jgi:hypothetical protein